MTQTLPGFAVIASFSSAGDSALPPQATLYTVPHTSPPSQSITIIWDTLNVAFITITGNNGIDPAFSFGPVSVSGGGVYVWEAGFTSSILLTLTAYDSSMTPLGLTATATVTIT